MAIVLLQHAIWIMGIPGALWPVGFPMFVSATGGDNIAAATIVTFILFALPALVAAGLILDGRRRLAERQRGGRQSASGT